MTGTLPESDFQSLEKIGTPVIGMTDYQDEAFWATERIRRFLLLWRRQGGKTTIFSNIAIKLMLAEAGTLVNYGSVSLKSGTEMILRVAQQWREALNNVRAQLTQMGKLLETNFDDINDDLFAEMFEAGRAEVKLWHDKTVYSRTHLIAANINTARGFSRHVLLDEIQSIEQLKTFLAEVREIASRRPDNLFLMAMTIPPDDSHYSCELIAPPADADFSKPNPRGHWYRSKAGIMIHRVDIDDAYAAGVTPYDEETGEKITPAQARERSIDKDGFDRNQKLLVIPSGICAIPMQAIEVAQQKGASTCVAAQKELPANWRDKIGPGRLTLGVDPATTEKESSNPTSFSLIEQVGSNEFAVRLKFRFKTNDPNVTRKHLADVLNVGPGKRVSCLVILATNERFFARDLQRQFQKQCHVELVVESETFPNIEPAMNYGTYMGVRLVNAFNDRQIWEPDAQWVADDLRLVIGDKGGFAKKLDGDGNHGDGFDSDKAALHGQLLKIGGPVEARAVAGGILGRIFTGQDAGTGYWGRRDGGQRRTMI